LFVNGYTLPPKAESPVVVKVLLVKETSLVVYPEGISSVSTASYKVQP
jgi:hypothetical protein